MSYLPQFIDSLSDEERQFICSLDYGRDIEQHRREFEIVIQNEGMVDFNSQLWYPYEVIELGKNYLYEGHEREFVACCGIVLVNMIVGADQRNDWEISMWPLANAWIHLSEYHRDLLSPYTSAARSLG